MDYWLNVAFSGLTIGAVYAIIALGFNVGFVTTHVLSFAIPGLFMAGGMIYAYGLNTFDWPVLLIVAMAVLIPALISGVLERVAVQPVLGRGEHSLGWVVSTLGAATVISAGIALVMSSDSRSARALLPLGPWNILGLRVSSTQLLIIVYALAVTVILLLLYNRTILGAALSAVAQDTEAARLRGLPVAALSILAFVVAGAIAAGGGVLAVPLLGMAPGLWLMYALKGFMAAAIGGIGNIPGALLGGLILGLAEAFTNSLVGPQFRELVIFVLLLTILVIRPQGIRGRVQKLREV